MPRPRKPRSQRLVMINARVLPAVQRALDEEAERQGVERSALVRDILEAHVGLAEELEVDLEEFAEASVPDRVHEALTQWREGLSFEDLRERSEASRAQVAASLQWLRGAGHEIKVEDGRIALAS